MKLTEEMKLMEIGGETPNVIFYSETRFHADGMTPIWQAVHLSFEEIEMFKPHLYKRFRVTTTFEVIESEAT